MLQRSQDASVASTFLGVREEVKDVKAVKAVAVSADKTDVAENSDTLVHISGLCVRAPSVIKWLKKMFKKMFNGLSIQAGFLQFFS